MSVRAVTACTRTKIGFRAIGSLDIDGQGTNHPLASCGLWVLADDASVDKAGHPPFGAHPHAGASIMSIVMKGKPWIAKDNLAGGDITIAVGEVALYHTSTGMVHDETTLEDAPNELVQLAFFNDKAPKPSAQKVDVKEVAPGAFQLLDLATPQVKLFRGTLSSEPITLSLGNLPVTWLYTRAGASVTVGDTTVTENNVALVDHDGTLQLKGTGEFFIGCSEAIEPPPAKILFDNGFSIAKDEAGVRQLKEKWEKDPKSFSRS